jgi:hypothetical protein
MLVKKANLTSKGLFPSSQELFDLMHITSCEHAHERWKKHWSFCPVCGAMPDNDGLIKHKEKAEITC